MCCLLDYVYVFPILNRTHVIRVFCILLTKSVVILNLNVTHLINDFKQNFVYDNFRLLISCYFLSSKWLFSRTCPAHLITTTVHPVLRRLCRYSLMYNGFLIAFLNLIVLSHACLNKSVFVIHSGLSWIMCTYLKTTLVKTKKTHLW